MDIKFRKYILLCVGVVILIGIVGVVFTYYNNRTKSLTYGYDKYNTFISNVEASQDLLTYPVCRANALKPLKVASKSVPKELNNDFLDYYKALVIYMKSPTDANKKVMYSTLTTLTEPIFHLYRSKNWDLQAINENALDEALKYGYPKEVYNLIT